MDVLTTLRDTPLPTILVVGGIFFLLLALVSQIGTFVTMPLQRQKAAAITGAALLILGVGLYLVPASPKAQAALPSTAQPSVVGTQALAAPLPLHSQLTTAAWKAYNKQDYVEAIAKAQECIGGFRPQAVREQQEYAAGGNTPLPVGAVDEVEKRKIFSRGGLNDVATCYYIKGQALEKLGRIGEAKDAYKSAQQFPDARTWDAAGFLWSPAQGAADRLAVLK
jgi:hypothetical protein